MDCFDEVDLRSVLHEYWCLHKQPPQRARKLKLVSDSPGLVDFVIGLVNSVFNLPDGQVMSFEEFE